MSPAIGSLATNLHDEYPEDHYKHNGQVSVTLNTISIYITSHCTEVQIGMVDQKGEKSECGLDTSKHSAITAQALAISEYTTFTIINTTLIQK